LSRCADFPSTQSDLVLLVRFDTHWLGDFEGTMAAQRSEHQPMTVLFGKCHQNAYL